RPSTDRWPVRASRRQPALMHGLSARRLIDERIAGQRQLRTGRNTTLEPRAPLLGLQHVYQALWRRLAWECLAEPCLFAKDGRARLMPPLRVLLQGRRVTKGVFRNRPHDDESDDPSALDLAHVPSGQLLECRRPSFPHSVIMTLGAQSVKLTLAS